MQNHEGGPKVRIVIIGAVAAGTSAAAKARRNNEDAEIVIYEKDSMISYSGCGMPYFLGNIVESADKLTPRDPAFFKNKYNVDVLIRHEVLSIHPDEKTIEIRNLDSGEVFFDTFDKLVVATGARSVIPSIEGIQYEHVFALRNIGDMNRIKSFINQKNPKTAVIIGSGFIGLEVCENLKALDIDVCLIEKLQQVAPSLDEDMSIYVEGELEKQGVTVLTNHTVVEIRENSVVLSDGRVVKADMIICSIGVRPNVELAVAAGIELGVTGAIRVDMKMKTNYEDIYACGDCTEQYNTITGKGVYRPMGSTANKTGRIAGDQITGGSLTFRGILGTGIFQVFDKAVAQTGLSEREAMEEGYEVVVCHNIKPNKPDYMGGKEMVIKGIADKQSGRLLGAQIVGSEGVDKRIDVFATAITFKALVEDLFHLDLAYSPIFSTTKDPVMYTGMILDNAINKGRPLISAMELQNLVKSGKEYTLIDARVEKQFDKSHIKTAKNIPHAKLRKEVETLQKDVVAITYCNKGVTGNAAQNILINHGFKQVYNLSGGEKQFKKINKTDNK